MVYVEQDSATLSADEKTVLSPCRKYRGIVNPSFSQRLYNQAATVSESILQLADLEFGDAVIY